MKKLIIVFTSIFSLTAFAAMKTNRKPATYDIDSQTAAERSAKHVCEVTFGESCTVGKIVCKDTSIDETTSTQMCQVKIKSVKNPTVKLPGGLSYAVEILNGRVHSVTEHCGMCD
jgi:hypothetical protein